MVELPSGTVTFLLTDVEGSTVLWEEAPEAMRAALARHDELFEATVAHHGGVHIRPRGEGDSRFAVFPSAPDAVAAAVAIQCAFAAEPWPTPRPIKVRIGVHTGEAEMREGDYYGSAVNRCARLRGIGHGGQVLLSEATAGLVCDSLAAGFSLLDLGEHRLRDLSRPERVHQVVAPGIPAGFPSLTSVPGRLRNLPLQMTPLLGRNQEALAVCRLLLGDNVRLVTLTGPGGTGKTRLGLRVATDLLDRFEDGACFVDLAPISDPRLVPSAVAHAVGVHEAVGRPLLDVLLDSLRGRQLLLVLDNFEQVLDAAPVADVLLRGCPGLRVLVTSRAALQLRGEHEYPVPPLALPDARRPLTPEVLLQYGAVALFAERAQAILPTFELTRANASAVAAICARLDGLPLAIELAAARVRLLSPEAMLPRLGSSLSLLTGGRRDLPMRQRTLRGAIAWSYDLLTDAEQRLFRLLSVFVGGFTLEAAEQVCSGQSAACPESVPSTDVLDGVETLVGHSLLRRDEAIGGEPRFRMLEMIREYAMERLAASGERDAVQGRHAAYFLELAVDAERHLLGADQVSWLDRLERDHDNVRAALGWAIDAGHAELAMRMTASLTYFWYYRSHYQEAQSLRSAVLSLPAGPGLDGLRAQILQGAGLLTRRTGQLDTARAFLDEGLSIARRLGDRSLLIRALATLGLVACTQRDYGPARAALEEGVALARAAGDTFHTAMATHSLGLLAHDADEDLERAWSLQEESLELFRRVGNHRMIGVVRFGMGRLARARGDLGGARVLLAESVRLLEQVGDVGLVPSRLHVLAAIDADAGRLERAVKLAGAASALDEVMGVRAAPVARHERETWLAPARAALGAELFEHTWAEGRAMTLEQAVAYALDDQLSG